MSRIIKFRAWDKETKTMSPPHSLQDLCIMKDTLVDFAIMDGKLEFMQYTGLKDKLGREIYEGDIILNNNTQWIIEYLPACFIMRHHNSHWQFIGENEYSEVIGNIYEMEVDNGG